VSIRRERVSRNSKSPPAQGCAAAPQAPRTDQAGEVLEPTRVRTVVPAVSRKVATARRDGRRRVEHQIRVHARKLANLLCRLDLRGHQSRARSE
jgi:hypothetical protein